VATLAIISPPSKTPMTLPERETWYLGWGGMARSRTGSDQAGLFNNIKKYGVFGCRAR
jgi:hypothetical protein